jgi:hypothetical protein
MTKQLHHPKGMCFKAKGLIFLPVPKNASWFLKKVCFTLNRDKDKLRKKIFNIDTRTPEDFVYTVVREPKDRFISGFAELVKRATIDMLTSEKSFYVETDPIEVKLKKYIKFMRETDDFYEPHTRPQYWFIEDYENILDYVINFNTIEHDILEILRLNNIRDPEQIINTLKADDSNINAGNTSVKSQIRDLVNSDCDIQKFIEEFYEKDFVLWEKYKSGYMNRH